ncbi:hypothetical protein AB1L88_25920 [Tautonia sp. JC769]|uniref:hypothetical protein n=1 Tax=Tautonia sp. JC769 TaxID=3232135 RepID=UPI003459452D
MEAIHTKTIELAGKTYRISVYPDHDCECPSEWESWRLISFGRRHTAYDKPERYCKGLDRCGSPLPASIGLSRKLSCGTAYWLSYFEHGLCRWSLMGEGPYCRWDSVKVAGILLWEGAPNDLGSDYPSREAAARSFLDTYTAWTNGEVYGFEIERILSGSQPAESLESCWGFYGLEHCLAEAEASIHHQHAESSC